MRKTALLISLLALFAFVACQKEETYPSRYDNVFVIYSAGFNNLSNALAYDIHGELASGELPGKYSKNVVFTFAHSADLNSQKSKPYDTPTKPVLIRVYKEGDHAKLDTVKVYNEDFDEIEPSSITQVFNDVKSLCPADHYGMLYTSHGSAWLHPKNTIGTKSIGARYAGRGASDGIKETDIKEFAKAFPMHLDYIIFDACYMGSVEVAYQLRSTCDYIIGSATEIPDTGFDYSKLPSFLFRAEGPDYVGICDDYIDISNMGGIIALVKTSELDDLASEVAKLVDKYHNELYAISDQGRRSTVQKYWCKGHTDYRYLYDLEDILRQSGATDKELAALGAAMNEAIIYEAHTSTFHSYSETLLEIKTCCGLSMYLPSTEYSYETENEYYKTLDFNKVTKMVK